MTRLFEPELRKTIQIIPKFYRFKFPIGITVNPLYPVKFTISYMFSRFSDRCKTAFLFQIQLFIGKRFQK